MISKLTKEPPNDGQLEELGANTNLVIGKDCQTAPYPKPDKMAGDHGHYEPSTF